MIRPLRRPGHSRCTNRRAAFTLVEMLAVLAIVLIVLGLGMFGLQSSKKTTARRNAVALLMGEIDQARVLALGSGRQTFLAFSGKNAPEDYAYRSYAIFQAGEGGTGIAPVTGWKRLPEGILLHETTDSITDESGPVRLPLLPYPGQTQSLSVPFIAFGPTGSVSSPTNPKLLRIVLCEGVREGTEEIITARGQNGAPLTDEIVVSRQTGRARNSQP